MYNYQPQTNNNYVFGQQNPPQQQFQYNQNQQFPQNILQNQQEINRCYDEQKVKDSLTRIFELQNQLQLQHLIQILQTEQKIAAQHLKKTIEGGKVNPIQPQQMDLIIKRALAIKSKNAELIKKILLIKAKLERSMYQDMNHHSKYEYETSVALDKIRNLKSEITQKVDYLKTLKVNNTNENGSRNRGQSKSGKFLNAGCELSEMKKGTEVLKRKVVQQKAEMEILTNYLTEGI